MARLASTTFNAIPTDVAIRLCTDIQGENRHKWNTADGMMCRGCVARYDRQFPTGP
jgi:hypothetical protein